MKKMLAVVLSLIMVLALIPASFAANEEFTLTISGGNTCNSLVEQDGKELLKVDLFLNTATEGQKIVSADFNLTYNPTQLKLVNFMSVDSMTAMFNTNVLGELWCSFACTEGVALGRQPLMTIFFEINENVALGTEITFGLKGEKDVGTIGESGNTVSNRLGMDFTPFVHTAHTPGEAVRENEVAATCEHVGGYDTVVYCTVCHKELSRVHTEIPKADHTPGEPVRENEVAASCTEAGGYDTVVYCTVCHEEISRVHTDIPATDHEWGEPEYVWNATEEGFEVTATAVCAHNEEHVLTETVDAIFTLAGKPIPGEACTANYVATFENELFEEQTQPAEATGWQLYEEQGYYLDAESMPAFGGWKKIDGKWFYFDDEGVLQTGWLLDDGKWYYLEPEGENGIEFGVTGTIFTDGWRKVDGRWYFFNPGGHIARNTWKEIPDGSGNWYYFSDGGQMVTGWQYLNGSWYYFNPGGTLVTGWRKINGNWYYFGTGAMRTGWQKIDGLWYYFKKLPDEPEGAMVTGEYEINGKTYYFDDNGVWIENP